MGSRPALFELYTFARIPNPQFTSTAGLLHSKRMQIVCKNCTTEFSIPCPHDFPKLESHIGTSATARQTKHVAAHLKQVGAWDTVFCGGAPPNSRTSVWLGSAQPQKMKIEKQPDHDMESRKKRDVNTERRKWTQNQSGGLRCQPRLMGKLWMRQGPSESVGWGFRSAHYAFVYYVLIKECHWVIYEMAILSVDQYARTWYSMEPKRPRKHPSYLSVLMPSVSSLLARLRWGIDGLVVPLMETGCALHRDGEILKFLKLQEKIQIWFWNWVNPSCTPFPIRPWYFRGLWVRAHTSDWYNYRYLKITVGFQIIVSCNHMHQSSWEPMST